jgi:hypothetical protein
VVSSPCYYGHERRTRDKLAVVVVGVGEPGRGELTQVAQADGPLTTLVSRTRHRNQDRQQNRNNRDDDQQLDQREPARIGGR